MNFFLALILVASIFFGLIFLVGYLLSGPRYQGPVSDHFDGKKFRNPSGREASGPSSGFKYMRERSPGPWKRNYETFVREEEIPERVASNKVKVTFVNHSTFLIQYAGLNILTDPIWSYRCSPFQFAGPHRMRPPGVKFEDLPPIDLVVISHNHYDHFDVNTNKDLIKKHKPKFIVPLGMKKSLEKLGAKEVEELDWFQETSVQDLSIMPTPANHFSSRGLFDQNATLWCGFLLQYNGHKVYFVGDTGYGPNFKKMGEEYGPIDLCLIPIGAYQPEWFMGPIHVSPSEALQVHHDIQSKQSIAKHFGTFPLADDGMFIAQNALEVAMKAEDFDASKFIIPDEGYSYDFDC